jgi:hypothetical protein
VKGVVVATPFSMGKNRCKKDKNFILSTQFAVILSLD